MSSTSAYRDHKVSKRASIGARQIEDVHDEEASSDGGVHASVVTDQDLVLEEKALVRKIDTFLLPTIFLM